MSLEQIREQNKQLTVEKALELFLEKGIEQTTTKDIALATGLTERSIYRYFETRADLILAAAFLFWEKVSEQAEQVVREQGFYGMTGIEQIRIMLRFYSSMVLEYPDYVRFILQAEAALFNAGVTVELRSRPPGRFDDNNSPLVRAIQAGLADGSVSSSVDVKELYYNTYDAILGVMQRQIMGSSACDLDCARRMEGLCDLFLAAFQGKL
ncbi:MAG: TetR/AcrR family transcriptional regulator [Oscillospiraceae bacterium]